MCIRDRPYSMIYGAVWVGAILLLLHLLESLADTFAKKEESGL